MEQRKRISQLVGKLSDDPDAYKVVYSQVYNELKKLAGYKLSSERKNHTISKTELVHEVYLKMEASDQLVFNDSAHFMAVAATCMRQLLIDYARMKNAQKRGDGERNLTYLDGLYNNYEESSNDLLNIDEALKKLEAIDSRLADVLTLRFFGEMKLEQIAEVMEVSHSTVSRDLLKAKGLMHKLLQE